MTRDAARIPIRLGDGRRASLRAIPGYLIVTYKKGEHNEIRREPTNGDPAGVDDRKRIDAWAEGLRAPEPMPPVLDAINWARQLVRDVQRLDEIEIEISNLTEEKARLRERIEEARK